MRTKIEIGVLLIITNAGVKIGQFQRFFLMKSDNKGKFFIIRCTGIAAMLIYIQKRRQVIFVERHC